MILQTLSMYSLKSAYSSNWLGQIKVLGLRLRNKVFFILPKWVFGLAQMTDHPVSQRDRQSLSKPFIRRLRVCLEDFTICHLKK